MSLAIGLGIGFAAAGALVGAGAQFGYDAIKTFGGDRTDDSNYMRSAFFGAAIGATAAFIVGYGTEQLMDGDNSENVITLEDCFASAPEGTTPKYISDGQTFSCSYE